MDTPLSTYSSEAQVGHDPVAQLDAPEGEPADLAANVDSTLSVCFEPHFSQECPSRLPSFSRKDDT
jgi:hypothetical protein